MTVPAESVLGKLDVVTVEVPIELYDEATACGVPFSELISDALRAEIERLARPGRLAAACGTPVRSRSSVPPRDEITVLHDLAPCSAGEGAHALAFEVVTPAEWRVLRYLTTHLTLAEIGVRLHIGRTTVKSHVASIYGKLDVGSRSEVVARLEELMPIDVTPESVSRPA